jgi:hypothetical protein
MIKTKRVIKDPKPESDKFCIRITQYGTVPTLYRIRRIHMFLGLLNQDPDPLVRGTDPDPDPSIIERK